MSSSIEEIKKTRRFRWGMPIQWHEIGPYTLLEYYPIGKLTDETAFHGWLDGKDVHESWPSLDTGIIGLVCKKYSGDPSLAYFFCRGIQAPPYDKEEKE